MTLRGFYKWAADGDPAGGPVSNGKLFVQNPTDPEPINEFDLEIEKKHLALVGLDPEKFDHFFTKYYDQIFRYAFFSTGDHDEAADVASETFARAWERRRQFRWQGYSFGAWLFQIARSVVSHSRRRAGVRKETEYVPEQHEPVNHTTPADVLDIKRDREIVRRCLTRLTPDQHEVVVMQHFMGMTTRQIALITEMPLGTVNSHLRRGKRVVMRCLMESEELNRLSEKSRAIIKQAAIDDTGLSVVDDGGDAES